MSDYRPLSCIEHERLEFAVLKKQRLNCRFVDDQAVEQQLVLLPTDVRTRDGAEWLYFRRMDGGEGVLRLDRLLVIQPDP